MSLKIENSRRVAKFVWALSLLVGIEPCLVPLRFSWE
jgi:hypothetical protein